MQAYLVISAINRFILKTLKSTITKEGGETIDIPGPYKTIEEIKKALLEVETKIQVDTTY